MRFLFWKDVSPGETGEIRGFSAYSVVIKPDEGEGADGERVVVWIAKGSEQALCAYFFDGDELFQQIDVIKIHQTPEGSMPSIVRLKRYGSHGEFTAYIELNAPTAAVSESTP
jgi:hypothetical protein